MYFIRLVIQGLQSLNQLFTTIILLKLLSVNDFGYFSLILLIGNFFLGIGTNSYIYVLSFNSEKNISNFLQFSFIFLFLEMIIGLIFSNHINFYHALTIFVLIRVQSARFQEYINRVSFDTKRLRPLIFSSIIKLFIFFSLIFFFFHRNNFSELSIFNILLLIEVIAFLGLIFILISEKRSINYPFSWNLLFSNKSKLNTRNFILYFSKAQMSGLVLSSFSLEGFSIFTACRILSSPLTILTPVFASLSFSNVVKDNEGIIDKRKYWFLFFLLVIYLILVSLFADSFYTFFYKDYSEIYLIYSLLHILIGSMAFYRSITESELQGFQILGIIFKVNLITLPSTIILSFIFIYYFEIFGALFVLLISEILMILMYKYLLRKHGFIL